jgi:hypothetical protein
MEQETRKQLIKKFREQVAGGKPGTRAQLLAYAFLRGRDYVALEREINEDHPSFGEGRNTFLSYLASAITGKIREAQFPGKRAYDLRRAGENEKAQEIEEFTTAVRKEVYEWIQEKYGAKKSKEAAA